MSVYASDFPPVGEVFPFSVMGDVHGGMSHLHHAVSRTLRAGLKTLVQVGDFWIYDDPGVLQKLDRMIGTAAVQSGLSPEEFQVFFADGNHENFEVLDPDAAAPVRMSRNLTYVPRGVALDIGGVRVGFLGGAESIDREYRTPGRDWWPQERMTVGQINRALEMGPVDVLVTHDTTESVYAEIGRAHV